MSKNYDLKVKIEKINSKAEGEAVLTSHFQNKVFLSIPYTLPDELVSINVKKNYSSVSINEILEFSADRKNHICSHFTKCGGCLLQHWDFRKYTDWKFNLLFNPIRKISPSTIIKKMQIAKHYSRRRCKIFVRKIKSELFIGFKSYKSNQIVNLTDCIILDREILNLIKKLFPLLRENMLDREEMLIHINKLDAGFDVLLEIIKDYDFNDLNYFNSFCNSNNIVRLSIKQKDHKSELIGVFDKTSLTLSANKIYMLPSPGGFFQATQFAEKVILDEIFLNIRKTNNLKILDLFSGSGTFSLPLLSFKHHVCSIDLNEDSIISLIKASKEQNIFNNLKTITQNLKKDKLEINFLKLFDLAILDPPRSGAELLYIKIAEAKIPKIISISCDLNTFLKDSKILFKNSYKLKSILPIDQFLFTRHLEIVGIFEL